MTARVFAGWTVLLLAIGVYWATLLQSNHQRALDVAEQARLRAAQTVAALSLQVEFMVKDVDYIASNVALAWLSTDRSQLQQVVDGLVTALPDGALVQASVADAQGIMVFSNLFAQGDAPAKPVSIADREHFKAHGQGVKPKLYISHPVFGRLSQRWSVQFSRPIFDKGRFAGVVVISIAPEYLAQSFRTIFPESSDVVLLLHENGSYLTRSHMLNEVLGQRVPENREFLLDSGAHSGEYEAVAAVDGVERLYAWHRVKGYPLVLSLGLNKHGVFSSFESAVRDSLMLNAIGTVLVLLGAGWINWLFLQKRRDLVQLQESRERLPKLAAQVPGLVYQYLERADGSTCFPYSSPGMSSIYRLSPEDAAISADKVFAAVHPDDLERVKASICQSAATLTLWRCEYRVRFADGTERWLLGQSNPERTLQGDTLWHGYIQDVTDAHHAAEVLQKSETRLRMTVAAVRDGLWELDIQSGAIHWDECCYEILGYNRGDVEENLKGFVNLMHPADRKRVMSSLISQVSSAGDAVISDEFRLRTAAGGWLWGEMRGQVVEVDNGQPRRMIGTFTDISARVTASQLRRVLLDQSAAAIFLTSAERRVIHANARGLEIFARPGESLEGVELRRGHVDDEAYEAFSEHYVALRETGAVRQECLMRDVDGRVRWFDISGTLLDRDEPDGAVVWTLIDINERKLAETALLTERLRLTALLEHFPGGVLLEDTSGQVVMVNAGLCEMLDIPLPPADLAGRSREWIVSTFPELGLGWMAGDLAAPGEGTRSIEVGGAGGRIFELDDVSIARDGEVLGAVLLLRDITGRKQHEQKLASLAATDSLTGLPNRRSFMARLEHAIAEHHVPDERPGVLLMLDIDHFKRVNDTYGHPVGDLVLRHLADVISRVLRRDDMAGRLGGEEFAILLPRASAESAFGLAERLRRAVCTAPLDAATGPILVTVSIGLAAFDGSSAESLLARADEALYEAKEGGRNRVCVWSPAV